MTINLVKSQTRDREILEAATSLRKIANQLSLMVKHEVFDNTKDLQHASLYVTGRTAGWLHENWVFVDQLDQDVKQYLKEVTNDNL